MYINDEKDIYSLILSGVNKTNSRKKLIIARTRILKSFIGFNKVAFDTRRIDQGLQINPRKGLQNYIRSEDFISKGLENKINNLIILKNILKNIEQNYSKDMWWQDSNVRSLLSHLDKALRTNINDGDFTETQQGVGSIDYLEELLYVRYRLILNELNKFHPDELKKILLSKDKELVNNNSYDNSLISTSDVSKMSYDKLLNTLFAGVKATKNNPNIKRKITIEIEENLNDS